MTENGKFQKSIVLLCLVMTWKWIWNISHRFWYFWLWPYSCRCGYSCWNTFINETKVAFVKTLLIFAKLWANIWHENSEKNWWGGTWWECRTAHNFICKFIINIIKQIKFYLKKNKTMATRSKAIEQIPRRNKIRWCIFHTEKPNWMFRNGRAGNTNDIRHALFTLKIVYIDYMYTI